MQEYIKNTNHFFERIETILDSHNKRTNDARALENIRQAHNTVVAIKNKIIENPIGIIWIDIVNHYDLIATTNPIVSRNLIHLFVSTFSKHPVPHACDPMSLNPIVRMAPKIFLDSAIDENTLSLPGVDLQKTTATVKPGKIKILSGTEELTNPATVPVRVLTVPETVAQIATYKKTVSDITLKKNTKKK